jgi:putative ABC transport system permease protein
VLGFTLLITLSSGIFFGLAPALQVSRFDLNTALKESGRSSTESFSRRRLRNLLVVSEIALALVLLVGAGLMIRSFLQLQKVAPGFNPDGVLAAQIALPRSKYREQNRVGEFHQQLLRNVASLPGVESVSVSMSLPPNLLIMRNPFSIEGQPPTPGQALTSAEQILVSPDYFRTLGIALKSGRTFTDADNQDAPPVMIINETMARTYFPDRDPIGRRIQTGQYDPANQGATVVGVVEDVKYAGLNEKVDFGIYTPFQQNLWWRSMFLTVKTKGDPLAMANSIRNEVWKIDGDLPVSQIKTMNQLVSESVSTPRTYTMLLGLFGAVAMLLATVGIYGVMSYTVSQRTREIGVRMAMGARRIDVLTMVVKQGMKLSVIGIAIGSIASLAFSWVMSSLLFEVSTTDPLTFVAIAALLTTVALVACYIPAYRATKVDPLAALRSE